MCKLQFNTCPGGAFIKHHRIASTARAGRNLLGCLFAAVVAVACSTRQTEPLAVTVPESAPESAPNSAPKSASVLTPSPAVSAPVPAPATSAWTLEGYKHEVARQIYRTSAQNLYEGAPPPQLKSVVVLTIAIDADGHPKRVAVLRSNGYSKLNQVAMQSVQRAAPLPRPSRLFMRNGVAEFSETWLFQDDGRFQIRSLALAQTNADD